MKWLFKSPENGLIDGLTREEWNKLGVQGWAHRWTDGPLAVSRVADVVPPKFTGGQYAPAAIPEYTPAAWPAKRAWQWRKLDADMDARTWSACSQWRYGGDDNEPQMTKSRYEGAWNAVADGGEWWAPADQDGNPCEWPEVEPQPVVVIPAAEMTELVLYGHKALCGTWKMRNSDLPGWRSAVGLQPGQDPTEEWTPCDEHGNFCELRRVVSDTSAEVERRRVDDLDEALRRAQKEEGWWREEAKRQESAKSKVEAQLEVARREVAALHEEVDDAHRRLNLLELIAEARKRGAHARRDGGSGVSGFYRRMRCGISEIVISIPNTESDAVAQKMAAELRRYAAEVEDAAVDRLNTDRGRRMARADAMDPDSDTARQIAGIDSQLTAIEEREARKMRAALEERRIMPIDAGATLDSKMRAALEENY